jgi:hypothetical protein
MAEIVLVSNDDIIVVVIINNIIIIIIVVADTIANVMQIILTPLHTITEISVLPILHHFPTTTFTTTIVDIVVVVVVVAAVVALALAVCKLYYSVPKNDCIQICVVRVCKSVPILGFDTRCNKSLEHTSTNLSIRKHTSINSAA